MICVQNILQRAGKMFDPHLFFCLHFSVSQDKLGSSSQGNFFGRVVGSQTPNTTIIYTSPYLAGIHLRLDESFLIIILCLGKLVVKLNYLSPKILSCSKV